MAAEISVLAAAVIFDLVLGEPPARFHPVVWMGRLQKTLWRCAPSRPGPSFFWGLIMAAAGPLAFGGGAWLLLSHTTGLINFLIAVYLLKSSFAIRGLATAGLQVRRLMAADDLAGARLALGSLVSRDTSALSRPLIAAAAIESVAENCSDSIVAPLLFYAVGGVPAALAYRAINTLDSMIGYRGELEWLGKAAARLDDLVNLVPARVTAGLVTCAASFGAGSARRALAIWIRDRSLTESPNAGHPMAAMAGALGVELEKSGAYRLGAGFSAPDAVHVGRAVRIMAGAAALALGFVMIGTAVGA